VTTVHNAIVMFVVVSHCIDRRNCDTRPSLVVSVELGSATRMVDLWARGMLVQFLHLYPHVWNLVKLMPLLDVFLLTAYGYPG